MSKHQDNLLFAYDSEINNFVEEKSCQCQINATTNIHKLHNQSSKRIQHKYKIKKEELIKSMMLELSWEKYYANFSIASALTHNSITVNSSLHDCQVNQLANSTFVPMLRQQAHITENYKMGECMQIMHKICRRPQSSSQDNRITKYDIQMAYTKKEALRFHKQIISSNNIQWKNQEQEIKENLIISRRKINHLRDYKYNSHDELIYCCSEDIELMKEIDGQIIKLHKLAYYTDTDYKILLNFLLLKKSLQFPSAPHNQF